MFRFYLKRFRFYLKGLIKTTTAIFEERITLRRTVNFLQVVKKIKNTICKILFYSFFIIV